MLDDNAAGDRLIKDLKDKVAESIDIARDYSDEEIRGVIENVIFERSRQEYMGAGCKKQLADIIFNSRRRLDVLQPLVDDSSVTEIMVNGPNMVFTERNGRIVKENIRLESEEKLYNIIQLIVAKVNRTVNEASPIVDARLKDGSRVNAVLPPIALNGPILTIRKFPEKPLTMKQLVRMGSLSAIAAEFLETMVRARYNIFICGGTGAGKTTFLNTLSNFIPSNERIVTIEDSAELQIQGVENIVRLEARNANTEGKGVISIRNLIKASLRMRPDRIIVGEIRGEEALDMLQAMNTGHDGSLSTGHANSAYDMLSRMETMILCGVLLPVEAIRQQIASAIDIIVYLGRLRDMSRRTLEICEVAGMEDGKVVLNPLFQFDESIKKDSASGTLVYTGNKLLKTNKLVKSGLKLPESLT